MALQCSQCKRHFSWVDVRQTANLGTVCTSCLCLLSSSVVAAPVSPPTYTPRRPELYASLSSCEECKGTGEYVGLTSRDKCQKCGGSGKSMPENVNFDPASTESDKSVITVGKNSIWKVKCK